MGREDGKVRVLSRMETNGGREGQGGRTEEKGKGEREILISFGRKRRLTK